MNALNREFLADRNAKIFAARRAGSSVAEIAKRFNMTKSAVTAAISRELEALNREALQSYPEIIRMELERLDSMQNAIWPFTQRRIVQVGDDQIVVDPDVKMVSQVMSIMDRRMKLLGLDTIKIDLQTTSADPVRGTLHGADNSLEITAADPKTEAMQLIELMRSSGILEDIPELKALTAGGEDGREEGEAGDDSDDGRESRTLEGSSEEARIVAH